MEAIILAVFGVVAIIVAWLHGKSTGKDVTTELQRRHADQLLEQAERERAKDQKAIDKRVEDERAAIRQIEANTKVQLENPPKTAQQAIDDANAAAARVRAKLEAERKKYGS